MKQLVLTVFASFALVACGGAGSPSAASPTSVTSSQWQAIPAPPVTFSSREVAKTNSVGRAFFARRDHKAASYHPCTRSWVKHTLPPDANTQSFNNVISDHEVVVLFNNRRRPPLLLDVRQAPSRPFPAAPKTGGGGGPVMRIVGDGTLLHWNKFYTAGRWKTVDSTNAPKSYLHDAVASAPVGEFRWGGVQNNGHDARGGGAFYDAAQGRWLPVPTAGGPGPRAKAFITWTGDEFLVLGGVTSLRLPHSRTPLDHGGLYNPKTKTWRRVNGTPAAAVYAATVIDGRVALMSQDSVALLDPSSLKWSAVPTPVKAYVQGIKAAHGVAAVFGTKRVFLLDAANAGWNEVALPAAIHKRFERVQLLTKHHLIVWSGKSHIPGPTGCENALPAQNCLPASPRRVELDGFALPLSPCSS